MMNVVPRNRSLKRSRSLTAGRLARSGVPRSLRYNGDVKLTRTVYGRITTSTTGFDIGVTSFQAINIVYDISGVTLYGNSTTSSNFVMPNAAEFSALYDLVRIDKVELDWSTNLQATSSGTNLAPKFMVCNDYNDGVGTASLSNIQEHTDCTTKFAVDGRSNKWSVKPKYQRIVYYTSLTSSYEATHGFVNADTAIPHYGTKLAVLTPAQGSTVDFSFKYYLTLKNVK